VPRRVQIAVAQGRGGVRGRAHVLVMPKPKPKPPARWFVYVARCADDSLYIGIARDVPARIAAHDAGRGARYTRGRGPLRVLATRRCATHGDALRLELALKKLTRPEKLVVVASKRKLAALAALVRKRTP
jgi:putative endonuclease